MNKFLNNIMLSLMLLCSCKGKTEKSERNSHKDTIDSNSSVNAVAMSKASLNDDTLMVNKKAAVIYQPDSATIERLKIKMGEENFYTAADDNNFYIANSIEYLEKLKVPMLNVQGKKFIQFIGTGKPFLIRTDTITGLGNIYLFEPGKQPYIVDITSMDTEAADYYK